MTKKRFFVAGMAAMVLVFGMVLSGCIIGGDDDDSGGGGGSPEVINGFYGVTPNGQTIEIVITQSSRSVLSSRSSSTVSQWTTGDHYFVYIDRVKVSEGTITVTAENGSITFESSDGTSVSSITTTNPGAIITITDSDGTTYSGTVRPAEDYYYCIGAATSASEGEIEQVFAGKTPEQVYSWCSTYGTSMFLDYPESFSGTWDNLVNWSEGYAAPDWVVEEVAAELTGKVSAIGWYPSPEGYNIMFYVSRVPLR